MSQANVLKFVLLLIITVASSTTPGHADEREEAEKARQQAFRDGMTAIVDDLNAGSYAGFVHSIDPDDMLERIYGLRLIDIKIKKEFTKSFASRLESMVKSQFDPPDSGMKATVLGLESRGDRGRAVVRFDEEDFQFRYHEYDLRLTESGKVIIVDWIDFLAGERFSEGVGNALVMGTPSSSAMRKLVDFNNASERELFQFGELLKAARDRQIDRYLEILDGLSPRFQRQEIVVLTSVQLAKATRQRRKMIAALQIMAEHFPDEPLFSLMLLDYYFPSRKYDEAMQALQRLSDRLDVGDAAMNARFSAAALVMGNAEDAAAFAAMATEGEPGLELGWLSAFSANVALADMAAAVTAAQKLRSDFDRDLDPETLARDRSYAQLLASSEYQAWRGSLK